MNNHTVLYNCRILYVGQDSKHQDMIVREFRKSGVYGISFVVEQLLFPAQIKERANQGNHFHFIVYDMGASNKKLHSFYHYCRFQKELKSLPFLIMTDPTGIRTVLDSDEDQLVSQIKKMSIPEENIQHVLTKLEAFFKKVYPNGVQNIDSQDKGKFILLTFPPTVDRTVVDELEHGLDFLMQNRFKFTAFDFRQVEDMTLSVGRQMFATVKNRKRSNLKFYSVNVKDFIVQSLKAAGLNEAFNIRPHLDEILKLEGLDLSGKSDKDRLFSFDVGLINPFLSATSTYLTRKLKCTIKIGSPTICRDAPYGPGDHAFKTLIRTVHSKFSMILALPEKFRQNVTKSLTAASGENPEGPGLLGHFYNEFQFKTVEIAMEEMKKNNKLIPFEEFSFKVLPAAGAQNPSAEEENEGHEGGVGIRITFNSDLGDFTLVIRGNSK